MIADLLTKLLAENELSRMKGKIMGKDTFAISAYLKGSVRKSEVLRTLEHKRSVKNAVYSDSVKTGSDMRYKYQYNIYNHEVSQSQPNKKGILKDGRTCRCDNAKMHKGLK